MTKTEITLQLRANQTGKPPYEFPLYGMDTYLTEDGKNGVAVELLRQDGCVHIITDFLESKLEIPAP